MATLWHLLLLFTLRCRALLLLLLLHGKKRRPVHGRHVAAPLPAAWKHERALGRVAAAELWRVRLMLRVLCVFR